MHITFMFFVKSNPKMGIYPIDENALFAGPN